MAQADGSPRGLLARLSRIDVLVIDDWAMAPLSEPERRDFWESEELESRIPSLVHNAHRGSQNIHTRQEHGLAAE
jgi:DNA replication protein DnaC